jgi:hypothetical protein
MMEQEEEDEWQQQQIGGGGEFGLATAAAAANLSTVVCSSSHQCISTCCGLNASFVECPSPWDYAAGTFEYHVLCLVMLFDQYAIF